MGVSNDRQVVGYDNAGGVYASRLWWMLRWMGHRSVAVLDGGWQAWLAAGLPVTAEVPVPAPARFTGSPQIAPVDANYVLTHLQSPDMVLIDARANDRYHGQNETIDPVGGHIPGALNRFFKDNLTAQGFFKSPAQLREDFQPFVGNGSPEKIVSQCGSGVTACHNLLAMEIAGLKGGGFMPARGASGSRILPARARPELPRRKIKKPDRFGPAFFRPQNLRRRFLPCPCLCPALRACSR